LTGVAVPGGAAPDRPALMVKVENLPEARPQTGLEAADIVYEEPVESGVTRFVVVYQCKDTDKIEPIRSARFVDLDIINQFGKPAFAYAGGIDPVIAKIKAANIFDLFYSGPAAGAFHRDKGRRAPHDLYSSSGELYGAAHGSGRPNPVFTYSPDAPAAAPAPAPAAPGAAAPPAAPQTGAMPAGMIHLPFSNFSDVVWRWDAGTSMFLRSYGTLPAKLANGSQISANNVVVQMVDVTPSQYKEDPTGAKQNLVAMIATGKPAIVFRNGVGVKGVWNRATPDQPTQFVDTAGKVIPLAPGTTWVELVPSDKPVTFVP